MNLLENKIIRCINFLVAQHNEVIPWYAKTNMDMYNNFIINTFAFCYLFYVIHWLSKDLLHI